MNTLIIEGGDYVPEVSDEEMAVMTLLNEAGAIAVTVKNNPAAFKNLANELQEASRQLYFASLSARGITNVTHH